MSRFELAELAEIPDQDAKPERWWLKISLLLLIGVLLFAIGFALLANERAKVRRRLALVDAIKGTGADVHLVSTPPRYPAWLRPLLGDTESGEVEGVFLQGNAVRFDAAILEELTELRFLNLSGVQFTDADMLHLAALRNLEGLELRGVGITDDGLMHLDELTGLKNLVLRDTKVTISGVHELETRLPNVQVYCR